MATSSGPEHVGVGPAAWIEALFGGIGACSSGAGCCAQAEEPVLVRAIPHKRQAAYLQHHFHNPFASAPPQSSPPQALAEAREPPQAAHSSAAAGLVHDEPNASDNAVRSQVDALLFESAPLKTCTLTPRSPGRRADAAASPRSPMSPGKPKMKWHQRAGGSYRDK